METECLKTRVCHVVMLPVVVCSIYRKRIEVTEKSDDLETRLEILCHDLKKVFFSITMNNRFFNP